MVHRRTHDEFTLQQRYCGNSVCSARCKDFHDMSTLWVHMYSGSPQCLHTLMSYKEPLNDQELYEAQERRQREFDLRKAAHRLALPKPPMPTRLPGPRMHVVSKLVAKQHFMDAIPTVSPALGHTDPIPLRPLQHKCFYILHLFSGQRRSNDYQDCLEKLLNNVASRFPVLVLSIDIVNGPLGDLSK